MTAPRPFDPAEDVRLLNFNHRPFKSLSGFQKFHRVPQAAGDAEQRLLHNISQSELDEDLDATFARLRNEFGFKRKELVASDVNFGGGKIETPFFDFEISVELDESEPGTVRFRQVISNVRDPEKLFGEPFQKVFDNRFSVLEITAPEPLSVEAVIDLVEEAEPVGVLVGYDKAATWCELTFSETRAVVRVDADTIRVTASAGGTPRTLFETFLDVRQHFEDALSFGDVW